MSFFSFFLITLLPMLSQQISDGNRESRSDLSFKYLFWKLNVDDTRQGLNNITEGKMLETNRDLRIPNGSKVLPNCQSFIKEFGKQAGRFIQCSVENARPFRFCEGCVVHYERASTIYNDIQQDDDTMDNCKTLLLDSDRVQVINSIQNDILNIWDNADCKNCFTQNSITEDVNGTVHYELTAQTKQFLAMYDNFTKCVPDKVNKTVHNNTACSVCRHYYRSINNLFDNLLKKDEGVPHVCMDIVDMMNYSRLMWGEELQCTEDFREYTAVVTLTCVSLMIPLTFYITMAVYGTKKERQYMNQKRLSMRIKKNHYDNSYLITESQGSSLEDSEDENLPVPTFGGAKVVDIDSNHIQSVLQNDNRIGNRIFTDVVTS